MPRACRRKLDTAVWPLPGILLPPTIMLAVPVQSKNEQSIEQLVSCWKNKHFCQLMGCSCINPVHIDHQYQRDDRHAGSTVSMFPNSSKPQINEECLLRTVESWESLSLADTSDLCVGCVGKSLSCWCHSCLLGRVAEADLPSMTRYMTVQQKTSRKHSRRQTI